MRKILMAMAFCAVMLTSIGAQAQWVDKVTLYVPNRVMDLMDAFTLNIGFGPTLRAELRLTHAIQIGAGFGYTAKLIKDINRQYGVGMQDGWSWYFGCIGQEDIERRPTSRFVREYYERADGFPNPENRIYNYHQGARDYWEIGGTLGAVLVEADLSIHPVEWVDALLGFVFIDIKGDDLTFESFE